MVLECDTMRKRNPGIGDEYFGIYRGVVTGTTDEEGLLRLKVRIPSITGDGEFSNVWPCVPPANNLTTRVLPKVGDPIWIMFEAGDVDHPVWMGTWLTATKREELL